MFKRFLSIVLVALIGAASPAIPAQAPTHAIERGASVSAPAALPQLAQRLPDTIPPLYMLGGDDKIAPFASFNAATDPFPSAILSHSRGSLATMFDSTGKLTYAPNNLLLNTATLGTQAVTVQVGVSYLLSINGTGSVTLTGASTAGPLNGTGASNRVDLKITAATSSLTLTVAGSVTSARLSAVTYETAFRSQDDVDNTAAAYYGPRIDYDPNTLAVKGLLIEEARTSLTLQSGGLASGWSGQGLSTGSDGTLWLDGGTARKLTLNTTTGPHTLYSSAVIATTAGNSYSASWNVKAGTHSKVYICASDGTRNAFATFDISGTADISASQASGASHTGISGSGKYLGNGWFRLTLNFTAAAATVAQFFEVGAVQNLTGNTTNGFGEISWTSAGTETLYVGQPQYEVGAFPTSFIPTAASSVTRAADVVQFTGAALTALQGSAGSAIVESASIASASPASITNIIRGTNSILYRDTTGKTGTTNGTTALLTAAAPTWNAALRNGLAWSTAGRSITYTSGAVATDANAASNGGTLYLGSSNGSAVEDGWYKSFAIYNQRLPDATLQAKSVVGASYAANDNGVRFAFANDNLPIHWRIAL